MFATAGQEGVQEGVQEGEEEVPDRGWLTLSYRCLLVGFDTQEGVSRENIIPHLPDCDKVPAVSAIVVN